MDAHARSSPLPLLVPLCLLAGFGLALVAAPAAAQPDASWSASGDVAMTYRAPPSGTILGRNASNIHETIETDIIFTIEVGGTSGASDDDPGTLSIGDVGSVEIPRDLDDVDVNVGTLTLTDSFVTGRFDVNRPTGSLVMLLSGVYGGQGILVSNGGILSAQASRITGSVGEGGIARVSGCTGSLGSLIGADIEIDASVLGSANFQGKQVITNTTATGGSGTLRQGEFDFTNVSLDVDNDFAVGGNTTGAVPTDTDFIMTSTVFESGTGTVRAGLGIATTFEMRGASVWRSFGLFVISNESTNVDINSGSRIDARADLFIASAFATIGSTTETSSRIDVSGDFDLAGSLPSALTIEDGGVVDVDGTFTIGPLATLNLNGGTLRVGAFDNSQGGVFNENGGTLLVPEAAGSAPLLAAAVALAWLRQHRERSARRWSRAPRRG